MPREKSDVEKKAKSVNMTVQNIDDIDSYIATNGGYFADVVNEGVKLFFTALAAGNNSIIKSVGLEDPDKTILMPVALYIEINKISYTQLYNLEKKKKVILKTLEEEGTGKRISKTKYVLIHENNPDFFKVKVSMMDLKIKDLQSQITKNKEESRVQFSELDISNN